MCYGKPRTLLTSLGGPCGVEHDKRVSVRIARGVASSAGEMFRKLGTLVKNVGSVGRNEGDGEEDASSASAVKIEFEGEPSGPSSPIATGWSSGTMTTRACILRAARSPQKRRALLAWWAQRLRRLGWLALRVRKAEEEGTKRALAPRKSTIKKSVYEPPNLQVALERMRTIQPQKSSRRTRWARTASALASSACAWVRRR